MSDPSPGLIPGSINEETGYIRFFKGQALTDGHATLEGGTLSNLNNPVFNQDAATKIYVLEHSSSDPGSIRSWKNFVIAASTVNVTLSGLQTIDNIILAQDDRVLLKNQTNSSENGLWQVSSGSWIRTIDAPITAVASGMVVYVMSGTVNAEKIFYCETFGSSVGPPYTVNTVNFGTNIAFTELISSAAAGGANTQVQYNSGGALAGSAGLTYTSASGTLNVQNIDSISNLSAVYLYANHADIVQLGGTLSKLQLIGSGGYLNPAGIGIQLIGTSSGTSSEVGHFKFLTGSAQAPLNQDGGTLDILTGTGSGTGVGGSINILPALGGIVNMGRTRITNTTASTSTGTGALVTYGGVGIGGSLYVGGSGTVSGSLGISGSLTVGQTVNTTVVTGLAAPVANSDAANKAYVDMSSGSAAAGSIGQVQFCGPLNAFNASPNFVWTGSTLNVTGTVNTLKVTGLLAPVIGSDAVNKTYADSLAGVPGGSNTQVQYNNAGAFGGISQWTTNGTTNLVGSGTSSETVGTLCVIGGSLLNGLMATNITTSGLNATGLTVLNGTTISSLNVANNVTVGGTINVLRVTGVTTPVLETDAANKYYVDLVAGGGGTPGGLNTQIQYNNAGVFGGISQWTTNGTTNLVGSGTSSETVGTLCVINGLLVTDIMATNITTATINVTGPSTFTGPSVFSNITATGLNATGSTVLTNSTVTGILTTNNVTSVNITTGTINVTGPSVFSGPSMFTSVTASSLNVSGPATISHLNITNSTITNVTATSLSVSNAVFTNITTAGLNASGSAVLNGVNGVTIGTLNVTNNITVGGTINVLKVTGITTPILDTDAVNKYYVDNNSGTPGGSNLQLQFNNAGVFGGATYATYNGTSLYISTSTGSTSIGSGALLVLGGVGISGDVYANNYNTVSDMAYKTNIEEIRYGSLETVSRIKGYEYNLKSNTDKKYYGFIAQQLEEIGLDSIVNGSDGYKTVNYLEVIPLLVEAVKELSERTKR